MVNGQWSMIDADKGTVGRRGIRSFEDLDVWRAAKELTVEIYRLTESHPFRRDRALKDQVRRAAISIIANIAEGFERNSHKEFANFLNYALGSAAEVKNHLILAAELQYIERTELDAMRERLSDISRQITGFMKYLRATPHNRIRDNQIINH